MERPDDREPTGRPVPAVPAPARAPGSGVVLWVALVAALLTGVSGLSRPTAPSRPRPTKVKVLHLPAPADPKVPVFSNPTAITNPLFPISRLPHVVQLGAEGGDRLRFELTLLPEVRTVVWDGRPVPAAVSQLVAYSGGRVAEVARDFHAQADDGSVWHFGEESANYDEGVLVDREGSWLAGRDGRPVMVMPAQPQVGDVFGSQAGPGQADEATVRSVDQVVEGPRGSVPGAILVQERLADGTLEDKTFAPGYGELHTRVPAKDELSSVAIAIPTDEVAGPFPDDLAVVSRGAMGIQRSWNGSAAARPARDWAAVSAAALRMTQVWAHLGPTQGSGLLGQQMAEGLADLVAAAGARRAAQVHRAATDVAHAALDLQLRYRPPSDVDRDRLRLWAHQVVVDAAAGEAAALDGDIVVLDAIWARIPPSEPGHAGLGATLADLRAAVAARNLPRASTIADVLGSRP